MGHFTIYLKRARCGANFSMVISFDYIQFGPRVQQLSYRFLRFTVGPVLKHSTLQDFKKTRFSQKVIRDVFPSVVTAVNSEMTSPLKTAFKSTNDGFNNLSEWFISVVCVLFFILV